jgi:hypothetical protein
MASLQKRDFAASTKTPGFILPRNKEQKKNGSM